MGQIGQELQHQQAGGAMPDAAIITGVERVRGGLRMKFFQSITNNTAPLAVLAIEAASARHQTSK